jgi:hypothetical protein
VAIESEHPGQLFDYLGGRLEERAAQAVADHVAACSECRSLAELAGVLKEVSHDSDARSSHPDLSELASFFYGKAQSKRSVVAAHVAACQTCASELSLYARADSEAEAYDHAAVARSEVPDAAREMIREWEESSFAEHKPAAYVVTREMLARMTGVLTEKEEELAGQSHLTRSECEGDRAALVPVIVVDRSGSLRRIEMFEKATDERGADVFRYPGGSERFDRRSFHALLDFGEPSRVVVSDLIMRDEIRLPRVERADTELRRADYFIIED